MSKRIDEQLRKVVDLARRAGPVMPPRTSETDDELAQLAQEARRVGTADKSNQS